MLRIITNFLYRRKDPTRHWSRSPTGADVDLRRCTLGGVPLGGRFTEMPGLGPSEDARRAARGYLNWYTKGLYAMIENERLAVFGQVLVSGDFVPFSGRFLREGTAVNVTSDTTPEEVVTLLGEPFGRSEKEEGYVILFYEYEEGELQFAFNTGARTMESVDFQYDPELSDRGACEWYGIDKAFPEKLRRSLSQ